MLLYLKVVNRKSNVIEGSLNKTSM